MTPISAYGCPTCRRPGRWWDPAKDQLTCEQGHTWDTEASRPDPIPANRSGPDDRLCRWRRDP